jgi:integrase
MRLAGYAESSIHDALCPMRAMYRLARSRGLTTRSPFDGLDRSELPKQTGKPSNRRLDERELNLFVAHATARFRPVLTVLAFTGLRISEALGLRWADVDFVDGELNVRTQLTPATKDRPARLTDRLKTEASERVVPMFPAVESALQELLAVELAAGRGRDNDLKCSSPAPAGLRFTGTSPERSNRPASGPASNEQHRRTSERRSARSPAGEASTPWRPRRSPGTRRPCGRSTTRARSARPNGTRLAGDQTRIALPICRGFRELPGLDSNQQPSG